MAVMVKKPLEHLFHESRTASGKRKFDEYDVEVSSMNKRRPSAKSYTVDICEQPRSMGVSFLDHREIPSSSSYIVGESSKAQVQTDPSLLLSNFRGTIKLVWYLVADDVRYPHPYSLEGNDCVEGVCTKTTKARGEVIRFPGLSIRKVPWKEMEQVLSQRVDRLKQLVPGMEFRMKSLRDYDLRSVKICFQALPQDAVHDYSESLKPVMTRQMHSKEPFRRNDPKIMSISESKGIVHGKTEVTLLVSNLKTDDVLVFFHYSSLQPRSSWQEFAEILSVTQTKHRQASILIHTPPFHNRSITEPKTVNVEIRLRDNSCSNTVKYTYTPTTQVVNRIQRRVKQKEPIYVNYYSCLGAVTNVFPLVPKRELHQDDDKSTSDRDEPPKTPSLLTQPRKQQPKTPSKMEDKSPRKSTSLPLPVGQSLQNRKLEGFNSKEEIGGADGTVDQDRLSRYLSLTNLNITNESIPNGLPSHEFYREEPNEEASGGSSCQTIVEENKMGKLSDCKLHSPSRENSPVLDGFQEKNATHVPHKDNFMDDSTAKKMEHTFSTITCTSLGISSELEYDLSKVHVPSESDIQMHSDLSHLSSHFVPTAWNTTEAAKCSSIGKGVLVRSTDSGYSDFRHFNSAAVGTISEQSDSSVYGDSTSTEKKRCTPHAVKVGKSTPTSRTTSPEAVNSTNDQQGAESNQNFGSSQPGNEIASEDGNREGDSHDNKGNDEAEDDTPGIELHPPRATQRIDHKGGTISLTKCDIILDIPAGALPEGQEEEIVLSVDWNDGHIPPLNSTDMNVAPIVTCYPTGLKFLKRVTLKIPHCAILPDPEKCKATVHCSQTDEGKDPDWNISSDIQVKCQGRYFHLQTYHFTAYAVTLDSGETSLAKEIMFIPYGKTRYSSLDNCEIRLYLYDYHLSNHEKIHQEELRFGGMMLDTAFSYQIVERHKGSIGVKISNYTIGWLLKSDNILSFSFKEVWNRRSWTKRKFRFQNISKTRDFCCTVIAEQHLSEVDSLKMEISNDVKNSPESKTPEQQASSVAKGPSSFPFTQQVSTDNASCDSGINQLHQHVHHHYQEHQSMCTPCFGDVLEPIIPHLLTRKLYHLLDSHSAVDNNWERLAIESGCSNMIYGWKSKQENSANFSPTRELFHLFEQERQINNLAELEELMKKSQRFDAAEVVAKFREQMDQPNSSPSTLPALTGEQAERPMSTDSTPSPNDINQPLFGFQVHNDEDGSERNNQESTTPIRLCTDDIPDDDSTPSTNNNRWSNAPCKKLYFDDVEELQEEFKATCLDEKHSI